MFFLFIIEMVIKMDLYSLFYNLTKQKADSITYCPYGITNLNYQIKSGKKEYFLRIPKDNSQMNRENEYQIIQILKNKKIDAETIYFDCKTGMKITKKIRYKHFFSNPTNEIELNTFLTQLKKLHRMKCSLIQPYPIFDLLENWKRQIKDKTICFQNEDLILLDTQRLYEKYPLTLCHNDLLYANILCCDKSIRIIDYEYAGLNIVLFDIMSFIKENNIDSVSTQLKIFKTYFHKVTIDLIQDLNIMGSFLDVYWGYWAYLQFQNTHETIYLDIFLQKHRRYHRFINHISN